MNFDIRIDSFNLILFSLLLFPIILSVVPSFIIILSFSFFIPLDCYGFCSGTHGLFPFSWLPFHCSLLTDVSFIPFLLGFRGFFFSTTSKLNMTLSLSRTVIRSAVPLAGGPYLSSYYLHPFYRFFFPYDVAADGSLFFSIRYWKHTSPHVSLLHHQLYHQWVLFISPLLSVSFSSILSAFIFVTIE